MAPMREHARVTICPSVAIEMIEMASGSSLWLAEQEWELSHLSFNISVLVCFWKMKNCFIELSPDMSKSTVHAASSLLEALVSTWGGRTTQTVAFLLLTTLFYPLLLVKATHLQYSFLPFKYLGHFPSFIYFFSNLPFLPCFHPLFSLLFPSFS